MIHQLEQYGVCENHEVAIRASWNLACIHVGLASDETLAGLANHENDRVQTLIRAEIERRNMVDE